MVICLVGFPWALIISLFIYFFLIIFFSNWEKSNDTPGSNFGAKNDFESDEKQSALDSRFIYNT